MPGQCSKTLHLCNLWVVPVITVGHLRELRVGQLGTGDTLVVLDEGIVITIHSLKTFNVNVCNRLVIHLTITITTTFINIFLLNKML